jgi:hypothetical protein
MIFKPIGRDDLVRAIAIAMRAGVLGFEGGSEHHQRKRLRKEAADLRQAMAAAT